MKQSNGVKASGQRTNSESRSSGLKKQKLHNFEFHNSRIGSVRKEILQHIQNWNKYKENSTDIQEKEKIKQFYKELEQDHSFIQWIFPNFFNSMFNSDSYRLTIFERNQMIENEKVKSCNSILITIKCFQNFWELYVIMGNQKQLIKINFRINVHNQLRLRRVLASLSVLGQRNLAIQLLELIYEMDNQLYGTQYYIYDLVVEEKAVDIKRQNQQLEDLQTNKIEKVNLKEKQEKPQIDQPEQKTKVIQNSPQKQQEKKQQIGEDSKQINTAAPKTLMQEKDKKKSPIVVKQQQEEFSDKDKGKKVTKTEDKTKPNFKTQNPLLNKQIFNQIKPNCNQGKFERLQYQLKFDEVKNYYVQGDLLDESWVTIKLFYNKKVDTQQ